MWLTSAQRAITALFRERLLYSLAHNAQAQQHLLQQILAANADTWFGRKYGFATIRDIATYQQRVPVQSEGDLQELVARIERGEQGVLTTEKVDYFQQTSGVTTGLPKLIPSTSRFRRTVWANVMASQGFLNQWLEGQSLSLGPGLMFGGTAPVGITSGNIPFGPASGRHMHSGRRLWSAISVTPFVATSISDAATRRYLHWRFAVERQHLSYISVTYIMPMLVLAQSLADQAEVLVRDVADGALSPHLDLTTEMRAALQMRLRPNLPRARLLEKHLAQSGSLRPRDIWPELGWLFTVYGPAYQAYLPQLEEWYGAAPIWGLPYLACEGIVGIPWDSESLTHLPAISSTFLEFIPEDEWQSTTPRTVFLSDVEMGKRYDVALTGWNGVYRYRLGDIVEIGDAMYGVPTLRILGRQRQMLSLGWEKMDEAQIVTAAKVSLATFAIPFHDFVADLDKHQIPGCYRLWIETRDQQDLPPGLAETFDQQLQRNNPGYRFLRASGDIGAPVALPLVAGTFARFRKQREEQGTSSEQIKIPHAVQEWTFR